MNWKKSSPDERRILANAIVQLSDDIGLKLHELLARIFLSATGKRRVVTRDNAKNFRRGKAHRDDAALVYGWLVQNYPELSALVDSQIDAVNKQGTTEAVPTETDLSHLGLSSRWISFVSEIEPDGSIEVVCTTTQELCPDKIASEDRASFRLNLDFDGYVLGLFQGSAGQWYPINLGDTMLNFRFLPKYKSIPFSQIPKKNHLQFQFPKYGHTDFCFVLSSQKTISGVSENLAYGEPIATDVLDKLCSLASEPSKGIRLLKCELMVSRNWRLSPPDSDFERVFAKMESRNLVEPSSSGILRVARSS